MSDILQNDEINKALRDNGWSKGASEGRLMLAELLLKASAGLATPPMEVIIEVLKARNGSVNLEDYIAHAINCHDELVEALEGFMWAIANDDDNDIPLACISAANEALAKAKS